MYIIIYNKKLQSALDIDINYFIKINKRYIVGERKGKGKEYISDGDLIFEGEYLNVKSNGYGKEYKTYLLDSVSTRTFKLFEGKYLNGKRNGEGIEYNNIGKLLFKGEYLNGKRNGYGKVYESRGKVIYEGEYFNGERKGKGKEYSFSGKLQFEGE